MAEPRRIRVIPVGEVVPVTLITLPSPQAPETADTAAEPREREGGS